MIFLAPDCSFTARFCLYINKLTSLVPQTAKNLILENTVLKYSSISTTKKYHIEKAPRKVLDV